MITDWIITPYECVKMHSNFYKKNRIAIRRLTKKMKKLKRRIRKLRKKYNIDLSNSLATQTSDKTSI